MESTPTLPGFQVVPAAQEGTATAVQSAVEERQVWLTAQLWRMEVREALDARVGTVAGSRAAVLLVGVIGGGGGPGSPSGSQGSSGTSGSAVGGLLTPGGVLVNAILATNSPGNCSGAITDAGHNLSSDGTGAFTNVGSLNNTNPKLGPLADNGGFTLTMALLPGSPAIDAGNTAAAPRTDQRGFPRPVGSAADIGAYEYCYLPVLQISPPQTGAVRDRRHGN